VARKRSVGPEGPVLRPKPEQIEAEPSTPASPNDAVIQQHQAHIGCATFIVLPVLRSSRSAPVLGTQIVVEALSCHETRMSAQLVASRLIEYDIKITSIPRVQCRDKARNFATGFAGSDRAPEQKNCNRFIQYCAGPSGSTRLIRIAWMGKFDGCDAAARADAR